MDTIKQEEQTQEVKVDVTPVRQDIKGNIDLEATLNKIRSEEKKKHQGDIDRYKKESEEKEKRLQEIELELKKIQDAGKSDIERALSQVQELSAKYTETEQRLSELNNQNRIKDLEIYKMSKLMGAGSELIPELVKGNTPEEIDLSIELAKAKYMEIVEKVKLQTQSQIQQVSNVMSPSNPVSNVIKQDKLPVSSLDVGNMTLDEYKKNREMLLKTASNSRFNG